MHVLPFSSFHHDFNSFSSSETSDIKSSIYQNDSIRDADQKGKSASDITSNSFETESCEKITNSRLTHSELSTPRFKKRKCKKQQPRQLIATPFAATIKQSHGDKILGIYNPEDIQYHAYEGIKIFFLTSLGLEKTGINSNGFPREDFEISIENTYMQVGKGSREGKNTVNPHAYDAAHDNAGAGLQTNHRMVFLNEIIEAEGKITPVKKEILKCKKLTEEHFQAIEADFTKAKEIFDQAWPAFPGNPESLFINTETDYTLNKTTEILDLCNRGGDKKLENNVRNLMKNLYYKVAYNELTAENACEEYCVHLSNYRWNLQINLTKQLDQIKVYHGEFQKLKTYPTLIEKEKEEILKNLHQLGTQFGFIESTSKKENDTKKFSTAITLDEDHSKTANDLGLRLTKNKKFIKVSFKEFNKKNTFNEFINWLEKRYDDLEKEILDAIKFLDSLTRYVSLMYQGTQIPDFKDIFMNESREDVKKRLIKALTPEKASKRVAETNASSVVQNKKKKKSKNNSNVKRRLNF